MWEKLNNQSKKLFQFLVKWVSQHGTAIFAIFVITTLVIVAVMLVLHVALGMQWADWTGLGDYTGPLTKDQRGKTLWDWLELLIIPVVLALGALWFNKSEKDNEQKIATNRQIETALQNYIDKMTELLLDKDAPLRKSQAEDEVRAVARTRTLTTLRTLDPIHKAILLQFLFEADLITKTDPVIKLYGAFLHEANLRGASLSGADLSGAYLRRTNLSEANLILADLRQANLSRADLHNTRLDGADLRQAILRWADLSGANLSGANLSEANLSEANLSGADLSGADLSTANLNGANLSRANLKYSKLNRAILDRTDLTGAILMHTEATRKQLDRAKSLKDAVIILLGEIRKAP